MKHSAERMAGLLCFVVLRKQVRYVLTALLALAAASDSAASSPEDTRFMPGAMPYDKDGNQVRYAVAALDWQRTGMPNPASLAKHLRHHVQVHAHGGGMYQNGSTFYWYGTTQKLPPDWLSAGINLYSTEDLATWKFEGRIFSDKQIDGVPFPHPYRIERPKVKYERYAWNSPNHLYSLNLANKVLKILILLALLARLALHHVCIKS